MTYRRPWATPTTSDVMRRADHGARILRALIGKNGEAWARADPEQRLRLLRDPVTEMVSFLGQEDPFITVADEDQISDLVTQRKGAGIFQAGAISGVVTAALAEARNQFGRR